MPFFTNSGSATLINEYVKKQADNASTQTYSDADYYIALADDKAEQWKIDEYTAAPSHDTTKVIEGTGPEDYGTYYSDTKVRASKLSIVHEPTKYAVMFPAILNTYSEAFSTEYKSESLYGRMDPVQNYVSTTRTISVSFTVLAYDEDHAHRNLHALSTLAQFLYPVYQNDSKAPSNATSMSESPLWRVRFANLIQRTNRKGENYISNGLLVAPTSFSFVPVFEKEGPGFFIVEKKYNFPKEIKISLTFAVLHEETLGWFSNIEGDKHKWIGNLDANNGYKPNENSTIFPWGDNTLEEVGSMQASTTNTTTTAITANAFAVGTPSSTLEEVIAGRESLNNLLFALDQIS
jgi:hypothetical protein